MALSAASELALFHRTLASGFVSLGWRIRLARIRATLPVGAPARRLAIKAANDDMVDAMARVRDAYWTECNAALRAI